MRLTVIILTLVMFFTAVEPGIAFAQTILQQNESCIDDCCADENNQACDDSKSETDCCCCIVNCPVFCWTTGLAHEQKQNFLFCSKSKKEGIKPGELKFELKEFSDDCFHPPEA